MSWISNKIPHFSLQTILVTLLPLVSLILIFPFVFSGQDVFVGDWHDILANTMPYHFLIDHPLSLWNNAWITGFPEISAPMSDRFYPFSFPAFFLTGDIYVINWVLLGHLVIAYATSMMLFSLVKRDYDIPFPIIPLFSLLYAASGAMLARILVGHIFIVYALAWIPLLYYAYFRMVRYSERTMVNMLIFILASLFILFSASVYYLFFAYLFIAIMLGVEYLQSRDWKAALPIFTGIALFLLLGAIKIVPDLFIENWIVRQDPIDPLSNGGSLESNLASFIFGTSITKGFQVSGLAFGFHESIVLIGIIPLFFAMIGFVYGDKKWTVPVFLSLIAAFIWADGGKTLLSFVHLLPVVESFRCPGRIFAGLIPLLLLIGIQGFAICLGKFRDPEKFSLTAEQKRSVLYGAGALILIKLTEILFQETISLESWLSILFVISVVGLLYTGRMSPRILLALFAVWLGVNAIGIALNHPVLTPGVAVASICIGIVLAVALFAFHRDTLTSTTPIALLSIILLIGITLPIAGSISHMSPFDPKLDESPAVELIGALHTRAGDNVQTWILPTGQSYSHIDYTYWLLHEGFHPARAYYAYYLENPVDTVYEIGNTTYYSADYIVDLQVLDGGETILPGTSFTAGGVPVYQSPKVLPNAFIIRNEEIVPVSIVSFDPDRVAVRHDFQAGDLVILKYSYFDGWKANGQQAVPAGNMIGHRVAAPIGEVVFQFESVPFFAGAILAATGLVILVILFARRDRIEGMMRREKVPPAPEGKGSARRRRHSRK